MSFEKLAKSSHPATKVTLSAVYIARLGWSWCESHWVAYFVRCKTPTSCLDAALGPSLGLSAPPALLLSRPSSCGGRFCLRAAAAVVSCLPSPRPENEVGPPTYEPPPASPCKEAIDYTNVPAKKWLTGPNSPRFVTE